MLTAKRIEKLVERGKPGRYADGRVPGPLVRREAGSDYMFIGAREGRPLSGAAMADLMKEIAAPSTTPSKREQVIANTPYPRGDYRLDVARGSVKA
jgi:hypothetical protein